MDSGIIRFNNVGKIYQPNVTALEGINLHIKEKDFVFLAGASGAGKSSLLKILFASEQVTTGAVYYRDQNLSELSLQEIAEHRHRVGFIFQDYKLLSNKTIFENIAFALDMHGIPSRESGEMAYQILKALGLKHRLQAYPRTLSGGEQQRVAIARALINAPDLILADEPTGNLDPQMSEAVLELLLAANACGATVVIASHNLQLIERYQKRTIVLEGGKIINDLQF